MDTPNQKVSFSRYLPIKKLDWLLVKSFIGPFILTFFIALFVLVMQFLWKYVDDLVGKGLSTFVLSELLFYASARLVPMALPLAVLLASIMTFGDLGEHMELTAAKSAGISLLRMMRPLLVTVIESERTQVVSYGPFGIRYVTAQVTFPVVSVGRELLDAAARRLLAGEGEEAGGEEEKNV